MFFNQNFRMYTYWPSVLNIFMYKLDLNKILIKLQFLLKKEL